MSVKCILQNQKPKLSISDIFGIVPIEKGGTGNTSGLAASATKLATARTIWVDLDSVYTNTFDGTKNIRIGAEGTLPVFHGGTGIGSNGSGGEEKSGSLLIYTNNHSSMRLVKPLEEGVIVLGAGTEGVSGLKGIGALFASTEKSPVFGTLPIECGGTGAVSPTAVRNNIGLGNVNNTSDANKPVSIAQQNAIDTKANVVTESLKDLILLGGVPYGKELTESWTSLCDRIKAGNMSGIHIGDFKTIQLTTGETVIMEVAGIDQYYRCTNQEIGHHVDFISRDCLAGTKMFNDTNTNQGTAAEPNPWRASKLFQTLNNEATGVFSTLPADLKPCIIEKLAMVETRFSEAGALNDSIGWTRNSMGKLWLPTEIEVFGNNFWSDDIWGASGGGCNKQYPIFVGGSLHLIKMNGNGGIRDNWWEASTQRASTNGVCCIGGHGDAYYGSASANWVCAPLCFRIG